MRECPCMWPGMDATATEADAYTGKPATHAVEAARDMRNILTDWSRACGTTPEWTPSGATTGATSYQRARAS